MNTCRTIQIVFASMLAFGLLAGCSGGADTPPAGDGQQGDKPGATTGPAARATELSEPPVETDALDDAHQAAARKMINRGVAFLLSQRQDDGGWSLGGDAMKPAITALTLQSLLGHPDFDAEHPVVAKGFEVLLSYRQPDGAIFDPKQGRPAYTTAIAVSALTAADDPAYDDAIAGGVAYLKDIQIQPGQESPDGDPITPDSPQVGGVGYGKNKEPNLSVLQFVMEAWHDAGVKPDDEAMERAVGFLTRIQNRSESNPMDFAKEGTNDGGFVYDLKTSKAGAGPGGQGMRSYGSMTYAGFKSLLYAGVDREDPRVRAAYSWIRRYWRFDSNPNMPKVQSQEGLYYYYQVLAKALRAYGQDRIPSFKDPEVKHNWRHDLIDAIGQRIREDGSWLNEESRWDEGYPVLVTSYCVMALQETLKD